MELALFCDILSAMGPQFGPVHLQICKACCTYIPLDGSRPCALFTLHPYKMVGNSAGIILWSGRLIDLELLLIHGRLQAYSIRLSHEMTL